MKKKLLISLSSLATIATIAPVLVITSCTGETPTVVNLIITPKTSPRLTDTDITALKGTALPAQLTALNKLFGGAGLSSANQANFKVSLDETKMIVTLTANSGFTINDKSSFDSNKYEIEPTVEATNLEITATSGVKLTDVDVAALEGENANAKWAVLGKLFTGKDFISENQDKFNVTFEKEKSTVTLTAATGYTIGGQQTLQNTFTIENPVEPTDLTITALKDPKITKEDIAALEGQKNEAQLTALQKLFGGKDLSAQNQDKFIISVEQNKKIVTLTAIENFTINTKNTLPSNPYTLETTPTVTDLKITAKTGTLTLIASDITALEGTNATNKLAALGKLFQGTGLISGNLDKFTIKIDATNRKVTLTPIENYTIDGKKTLESGQYTLAPTVTELNITAITKAATLSAAEVAALSDTNTLAAAKLVVLGKLFQGTDLKEDNLANFKVGVDTTKRIVTLTAEANYSFANAANKLESKQYTLQTITDLKITAKSASIALTGEELIDVVGKDAPKQLDVLIKLFDGVDKTKQTNFTTTLGSGSVVTLTAKPGFTFANNKSSINSTSYTITETKLNITISSKQELTSFEDERINATPDATNSAGQLLILKKLFTGIKDTDVNYFTFEVKSKVVTLKAKTGFVFGGATGNGTATLVAPAYTINTAGTNLNIKVIDKPGEITAEDYGVLFYGTGGTGNPGLEARLKTLSKLFTGITLQNITLFNYNVMYDDKTIKLTIKDGNNHFFGEGTSAVKFITSKKYTEKLTLITGVSVISETVEQSITTADLAIIENNNATAKQKLDVLNKLFKGLTEDMISKQIAITVNKTSGAKNGTIVISPKAGYNFANNVKDITAKYKTT
ncbi:MAG: hypothetical protein ACRC9U_02250 [Metamycoplasmataceae bacterium]